MIAWAAAGTALLTLIGLGQAVAGWWLVVRFTRRRTPDAADLPPVTVLKPLYGDEPLLEPALASVCVQNYPSWQVVFGVQSATDPAIAVVRRLQQRFPERDLVLVVNPVQHGPNRKVGNLINMMAEARHDVLVIADLDVHVRPDYLRCLVAGLAQPNVGLVTTLYVGLPAHRGLPAVLGTMGITCGFLPGALLARAMGRQDCLGATMALRRDTLAAIGGFPALVAHLADDNVLGRRVRRLGLDVALADTVPATTVPEATLLALFRHELRWARTIRALEPAAFAASVLQYPLAWALVTVLLAGGALWAWGLLAVAWVVRALVGAAVERGFAPAPHQEALPPGPPAKAQPLQSFGWLDDGRGGNQMDRFQGPSPLAGGAGEGSALPGGARGNASLLWPLRDLLSVMIFLASHAGKSVDWRGHELHADSPYRSLAPTRPGEMNPR